VRIGVGQNLFRIVSGVDKSLPRSCREQASSKSCYSSTNLHGIRFQKSMILILFAISHFDSVRNKKYLMSLYFSHVQYFFTVSWPRETGICVLTSCKAVVVCDWYLTTPHFVTVFQRCNILTEVHIPCIMHSYMHLALYYNKHVILTLQCP
jgi:hypothetical protein